MDDLNKFNIYRCPDPIKSETSYPWYRITDICPCNPESSNVTGRGFTPCPFGLQDIKENKNISFSNSGNNIPKKEIPVGSMYSQKQYVAPQLEPRQLVRIGQQWRSGN